MRVVTSAEIIRKISSEKIIRKTSSDIKQIIKELEILGEDIRSANAKLPEWTDKKSEEFKEIMDKIAKLTVQPNQDLTVSVNAMKKMEKAIRDYERVRLS